MKKRKGALLSLINYQCLKQAKKQRGEGEGEGREKGGGVSNTQLNDKTIALLNS